MKRRSMIARLLILAMLWGMPAVAAAEPSEVAEQESYAAEVESELLDYIYHSKGSMQSKTQGTHDYENRINLSVPQTHLEPNGKDGYVRAEHKNGKVYIEYYDKDLTFLPEKSKTINVALGKFGGVFYGKTYNYIFSGNGSTTEQGELALQQFDKNWNYITTSIHEEHSLAQHVIYAGTAAFSEYGNTLYIHTCIQMHANAWGDGGAHQGCLLMEVEQDTLSWALTDYFGASHSFNQYVINDGVNFYTLDQSDGAPRGMKARRVKLDDYTDSSVSAYHICWGSSGTNQMGANVGGFDFAGDRILTVVGSVDQETAWTVGDEQKNIVVYSHSKDLSEYKEVYLTDYASCATDLTAGWIDVGNPYLVTTGTEYSYVMWEEWSREDGLHYIRIAKVDSLGNLVGDIHSVYGRFSDNQPFYQDGHLVWYHTGRYYNNVYFDQEPTFYKLNLQKLEAGAYDFIGFIDIEDFDIKLDCYDFYYEPNKQFEPQLLPIKYRGYELQEGVDYYTEFENNYRVGKATIRIIGNGPYFGGVFGGEKVIEYNIHKMDVSKGWELRLTPTRVVFDPNSSVPFPPEYAVYNARGEHQKYITGKLDLVSGFSTWAAGTLSFSFTPDYYGHEGKIYADIVIEPCPAENLEIEMADTFTYTGKQIKPSFTVYHVSGDKRTRVESGQQYGSRYYTNYTVSYGNNVEVGTGTVTIKFEGNYKGTVVKNFAIQASTVHTHSGGTATCKTLAKCSVCGKSYGSYAKHKAGEWVVTKPATETSAGTKVRYCTECGATVERSSIPKLTSSVRFTDVKSSDFFYTPVQWAVNNGVTTGTSKTTFGPEASCTRAQAVTFLWRAAGCPAAKSGANPFNDIKASDYYYKAVLWAASSGVTSGTSKTTFSPSAVCTRGQIVTFLWRSQGEKKVLAVNPFKDVKKSDFYYDAVLWAVKNNVTTGTSSTTFSPAQNCTRGQIVTFLYRAIV